MSGVVATGSIRRRLLISLLAGAAVLSVTVYFMVLSVARQVAQESQDNILSASAVSILDSARFRDGRISVDLPYSAFSMLGSVSDERVFYAIRLGDDFLSGYPDLPEATATGPGQVAYRSLDFLGEEVRVATLDRSLSTDIGQQQLRVSVAQTLSGQRQIIAGISRSAIVLGAGVFALLVLLAGTIARNTIRPLDRLTASVSRRGPKDLRPVAAPVPSEMVPLTTSLNRLMARLQRSLLRSEDLITEAAHRIRTPLAIVRTKAEIIQRKADEAETRDVIGEMIHAIDDASRTAGQLLDHAMVTFRRDDPTMEEVDLVQLAQGALARIAPLSELRDIAITTDLPDEAPMHGDPILLQNALQNLLDNAMKYAPAGARIDLEIQVEQGTITLNLRDTGPGFPAGELGELTTRFSRGSNAVDIVGSGLGLTIVQDIMEAHGGRMTISNDAGGGACVALSFPRS